MLGALFVPLAISSLILVGTVSYARTAEVRSPAVQDRRMYYDEAAARSTVLSVSSECGEERRSSVPVRLPSPSPVTLPVPRG